MISPYNVFRLKCIMGQSKVTSIANKDLSAENHYVLRSFFAFGNLRHQNVKPSGVLGHVTDYVFLSQSY